MAQNNTLNGLPSPLPFELGGTRMTAATRASMAGKLHGISASQPTFAGYAPTKGIFTTTTTGQTQTTSSTVAGQFFISSAAGTPGVTGATAPYPSSSGWTSFTPTITVSGGTVPTYTAINSGRWRQVGNVIHVRIVMTNSSGGTAGAGTNAIVLTLPTSRGASASSQSTQQAGYALNGSTYYLMQTIFGASANAVTLSYKSGIVSSPVILQGVFQNNAVRELHLSFCYEK